VAPRVLIAAGGTGGHVFPALACAEEFKERGWEVCFVGVGKRLEHEVFPKLGKYFVLKVNPLRQGGNLKKVWAFFRVLGSLKDAVSIIEALKPQLVLGFGSYVSGPVIVAAWLKRVKRAIHEQNVLMGFSNRMSAPFAQRVFVSFEETLRLFPSPKVILTGNPVRKSIIEEARGQKRGERFTLFVLGGSQGARPINRAVVEVINRWSERDIEVIHQTGFEDLEFVKEVSRKFGLGYTAFAFDPAVGRHYGRAHLVLCRAGALTLAELGVVGRASILVPYPHAVDRHQLENAKVFERKGASKVIMQGELTPERLFNTIKELKEDKDQRAEMEKKALSLGKPWAAKVLVDRCEELLHVQG